MWSKRRASFKCKFRLNIDTFLEQDTFKQRVLVPEHQTFVGGGTVTLLEVLECFFMMLDGGFELFDILGPSFTECCLSLAISLLALF